MKDSGVLTRFSQPGLEAFMNENTQSAAKYIYEVTIPDFSFEAAGFRISFRDVKMDSISFPNILLRYGVNTSDIEMKGLNGSLVFQFQVL